jgi:D-glycero-alpha-D-manno-heptose-7-phosphate kinase
LDHKIRLIPLLDENRRLVQIATRQQIPPQPEKAVYARARAPVRMSFGGGGSDLTHYFSERGGAVVNSTISLYSHATLLPRKDESISVRSHDLGETLHAHSLDDALSQNGNFGLVQALLRTIRPTFGFDLFLHSDFPMKSGLGGSAAVSAAVIGCFNQFRLDKWNEHEMAEMAFQAERLHLGIAGGWQDQYATVFGGFNFMEFDMDANVVHPLRIKPDVLSELEESLLLFNTGTTHESGSIHEDQKEQMKEKNIRTYVQENVDLTYVMRNNLLRGRLLEFGQALHKSWMLKRRLSSKITNAKIDSLYDIALQNGAVGGKLLGAGGGGFLLFYSPPQKKYDIVSSLEAAGLVQHLFRFEPQGLCTWTVREQKSNIANGKIDD